MSRRMFAFIAVLGLVVVGVFLAWRAALIFSGGSLAPAARDPWTTLSTVHSDLLARDMAIEVFAPTTTCATKPPLLVLFHGRGGDERQWMEGSVLSPGVDIDLTAHRLIDAGSIPPVTIVSAAIDDSYGVDSTAPSDGYAHGPYEQYIVNELVPTLEQRYRAADTGSTYLGGLSMGGFAALNAAFEHPDRFAGVGASSPAFFISPPADRAWIYQSNGRSSILDLAATGALDGKPIFLGYGDHDYDWIQNATARLAQALTERGVANNPTVVPGGHETATWRQLAEPMLLDLFRSEGASC